MQFDDFSQLWRHVFAVGPLGRIFVLILMDCVLLNGYGAKQTALQSKWPRFACAPVWEVGFLLSFRIQSQKKQNTTDLKTSIFEARWVWRRGQAWNGAGEAASSSRVGRPSETRGEDYYRVITGPY